MQMNVQPRTEERPRLETLPDPTSPMQAAEIPTVDPEPHWDIVLDAATD